MSEVNLEVPEIKSIIRSLVGLPKTIEQISKVVDFTQRELIETRKLIQNMRLEPYDTLQVFIKRIASVGAKFDTNSAQFEVVNPFDKDMRLISMILIPDANMKTLGESKIAIADIPLFEIVAGDFTDVATSIDIIPVNNAGKIWKKQKKLKVHLWSTGAVANITLIYTLAQHISK